MHRNLTRAALLAGLLLTRCAEIGKLAASAIEQPKLTFKAVRLQSVDLAGAALAFDFELENPNSFGLQVARAQYGIEVEGTRVTAGELPGGLALPAKGKAPLTVTSRVRYQDVPGIAALFGKRDSIRYKLSGLVGIQTTLGVIELPFAREDQLPLPHLPAFSLEGLRLRSASFDRIALEVRVRIANANDFPLPAGKLRAALSLAGSEVARVEEAGLTAVPAGGSALVAIPIDLPLGGIGRAATDLARGAPVDVGLRGAARIAGVELPLDLGARLPAK
jgi:LEA14-like dessication related protein